jgi:hypothetical protein
LVPLADGCLKISHTSIDADRIHNKKFLGSNYEIDSKDVKVYYGRKINDKIALGLLFKPWSSTEVKLKFPGADLGKSEGKARFNIRPGFLYQPIKNWYLGLTYEYADERIKTTIFNPITFAKVKTTEDSYTRIWRMGGSFEPKQGTLLALDWQVGEIDGPERGDYNIDMFFFGIEQHIHQNMALRMGSLDGSITAGIGISYKNMHLDYSYIKESLKDLNPHCGSSKTHAVAISLTF